MKMLVLESRASFVHYTGHIINLLVQVAISVVPMFRDSLHIVNFVRNSPKPLRIFEHLQMPDAKSLRPSCPTRWVMRECSLKSMLTNYTEEQKFMKEIIDSDKSEADSEAGGFCQQFNRFETFSV